MKSVKTRLVRSFILVIAITVVILEVCIIILLKQNYYKNLEDNMKSQVKISADLYNKYFSNSSLSDNVLNNVDTFWKQTQAEVQIINTNGDVIMDSIGVIPKDNMPDVKTALKGGLGVWTGWSDYTKEKLMAVSYPLKSDKKTAGVIRIVSSLKGTDSDIRKFAYIFGIFGIMVIIISVVVSVLLSNTIVEPLKEVTDIAKIMAAGNFKIRSKKRNDDEIGDLSSALNSLAQEIVSKEQIKNEFISSVSHELRTPLTSIKGWAITLKDMGAEDKSILLDGLNIIEKESDRLTWMVEELLDFSKFISGKIVLKKSDVDLRNVVNEINKELIPRATRDNIEFAVFCDDIPAMYTDEYRLKQLFINLLDNSFKFTEPGGKVKFEAKLDNKRVIFKIEDTGCGISKEELPKVKEKFYKGKSSKSQNGIGLSICDEIVKLMNGTFDIQSELGKGTTVLIALPLEGDIN